MRDVVIQKCISVEMGIVAIPETSFTICNDTRKDAGMNLSENWQYITDVNI